VRRPTVCFNFDNFKAQRQYREPTPAIESSEEDISQTEIMSDSEEESLHTSADMESIISESEAIELAFKAGTHSEDPKTFAEAMKCDDADLWYKSACDEIQTHLDSGT
jgi:hypothetical protein